MDGGLGRGRGRGRAPPQQEQQERVPSPPEEDAARAVEEVFEAMYVRETVPAAADSDRGRTRGRGVGRGRGVELARGAALGARPCIVGDDDGHGQLLMARALRPEMVARYEEDEVKPPEPEPAVVVEEAVGDAPESPKEPEQPVAAAGSPPAARNENVAAAGSPPAARNENVAVAGSPPAAANGGVAEAPTEAASGTATENNGQKGSVTSMGPGSTGFSSKLQEEDTEPPVVSRIGTKGDQVPIATNYLRLKLKPDHPGVVQYHVSIQPSNDSVGWRRKVLGTKECEDVLGTVRSFDGMVLYLPHIMKSDVTKITTHLEREPDVPIKVTVTFTKVALMNEAVIFFNVLLRKVMRILEYQEMRREYYDLNMITALSQHKLEIWPGLSLTTENQEDGLMICVDTRSRVLRQDTVYDYLKSIQGDPQLRDKFDKFIINKIVITKYNNKCYKIDDVDWDSQPNSTFTHKGEEVTFIDYMKMRYQIGSDVVTDMNQPMLISKLKPRKNEKFKDEGERTALLIPQCCNITGLTEDQKANFKVMTDLAASTRLVPVQRVADLDKFIARLLGNEAVKRVLAEWGFYIERNVIEVVGRRADGPNLDFNSRLKLQKAGPDFSREAGKGVYDPIEVKNYVLICTQRDADKAKRFMETYKEVALPLGIKMMNLGKLIHVKGMKPSDFNKALEDNINPNNDHFVVVLMPVQRDDLYSAIKRFCVTTRPIPSQCILTRTLGNEKRLRSIVLKIALQINCKLGGSLWALRMPIKEEIMFIGIDAAHDPLKKDPSVVCLVASLNNECTKYFSKSISGKVHQELAVNLGPLTGEALKEYHKLRNKYPDRIIVFRDGGSVGAMDSIMSSEMKNMQKAVNEVMIDGKHEIKFTFTLVTKRIPQRFFAKKGPKFDNPDPGTVIDSVVTRRYLYDFYVVSQQVRQGTVNPTHFIVADTDDPIRPDLIQKLSYVTCFMYYNWSGTVRVPAMVQYAHKLSALLIRHVKADPHPAIATTLYYL